MLPIYVMHDSGLDLLEQAAVVAALQEWRATIPDQTIVYYGSKAWSEGDYSSADWYVARTQRVVANGGGTQLNADHLLNLVENEPWQRANPHLDVVIVSHDITAFDAGQQLNFVFGLAGVTASIQSVARFRDCSETDRYLAVKTVVWHELGHILGAAGDLRRSHTEYNLGPHCTNWGCCMRQGTSVQEWTKHARETFQSKKIYCSQCLSDVLEHAAMP